MTHAAALVLGRYRVFQISTISILLSFDVKMSPIDIDVFADYDKKYFAISCLMFFCSQCPRAQPFVKVGARAPVPHDVGTYGSRGEAPVGI